MSRFFQGSKHAAKPSDPKPSDAARALAIDAVASAAADEPGLGELIKTVPPFGPAPLDLERAQLRMRAIETATIFRRENTPVETLLENAEKLFAWVIDAPKSAAPQADKNSGDPS